MDVIGSAVNESYSSVNVWVVWSTETVTTSDRLPSPGSLPVVSNSAVTLIWS